jgi:hypothetical protein
MRNGDRIWIVFVQWESGSWEIGTFAFAHKHNWKEHGGLVASLGLFKLGCVCWEGLEWPFRSHHAD